VPLNPRQLPQVVCPGGLISIMAYRGHPGGVEEYEAARALVAELSPAHWLVTEHHILNKNGAPVLILVWRRPDLLAAEP
jgi:Putative rRNA methylase